jgi:hypothetical protein
LTLAPGLRRPRPPGQPAGGAGLFSTDLDTLRCPECGADYTLAESRVVIGVWQQDLAWVDLAPKLPG